MIEFDEPSDERTDGLTIGDPLSFACSLCGRDPASETGVAAASATDEQEPCWLCSPASLTPPTLAELYGTRPARADRGYGGLPDPVGLPSIGQITDLNQPSDTHLTDGFL